MKRALCIAVSIAVMVVFSFADVMAVTKTQVEGDTPEVVASGEDAETEVSDEEEPVVETPVDEEQQADENVDEEQSAEPEVVAQAISGVALKASPKDTQVELSWTLSGKADPEDDIVYIISQDEAVIVDKSKELKDPKYTVTGLKNGTQYKFKVEVYDKTTETVLADDEELATPVATTVGNVTGLKWTHDFASVNLTWNKVEGADGYIVYRDGTEICKEKDLNWNQVKGQSETATTVTWRVRAMERKGTSLATYKFEVVAFKYKDATKDINTALKSAKKAKVEKCSPCRALYATFTPKKTGYAYKSAKGKKKGMKLKKGKKYIAKGFVCSRFRVCKNDKSGKVYFYPRVMGNNKKLLYSTKISYTHKEAADFVNHMGLKSGSKYLVWISLYTQHIYFFKGSKGKWKPIKGKNWEISSGKLMSCTATGNWKVFRKWRTRRGLSYWTNFYSQVAMHSWGNPSCFGVPHSGGCVRNTKSQAKWIYKTLPMKTTVCVY
ncbi:MAG: hypothetical protein E7226_00970 [Clostridiales bacterium]|nr:hypothetical protein [Clostridiales bacterium]